MAEITLTAENFRSEVLESSIPVLVDFWAPWCGPCKMLSPVISQIAEEYDGKIKVGKVNVDDEEELADGYGVQSIPLVLYFKGGEEVSRFMGYRTKAAIEEMIK